MRFRIKIIHFIAVQSQLGNKRAGICIVFIPCERHEEEKTTLLFHGSERVRCLCACVCVCARCVGVHAVNCIRARVCPGGGGQLCKYDSRALHKSMYIELNRSEID